ncbi:MAG: DUF4160 domain-containing protein [Synergistaceae bacterium]|nr:DUF4160 domain-containing protein [Synergistaceae bacterium]
MNDYEEYDDMIVSYLDSKKYGRPCMTDLPPELGRAIITQMLNTPPVDWEKMKAESARLSAEFLKMRQEEEMAKERKEEEKDMPIISMFFGIIIRMFTGQQEHNPPHFHAEYQGHKGTFDFEGNMLNGDIPPKQQKYISVWADIHSEELFENWNKAQREEQPQKIDPLR